MLLTKTGNHSSEGGPLALGDLGGNGVLVGHCHLDPVLSGSVAWIGVLDVWHHRPPVAEQAKVVKIPGFLQLLAEGLGTEATVLDGVAIFDRVAVKGTITAVIGSSSNHVLRALELLFDTRWHCVHVMLVDQVPWEAVACFPNVLYLTFEQAG